VLGKNAQRYPEVLTRVAKNGNAIGNHSWDHSSFPLLTGRHRRAQIRACGRAIAPYGKRLFRPPYGHQSISSRFDALLLGYQVVTWNVSSRDWLDFNANKMLKELVDRVHPGSIVLFHDAIASAIEVRHADQESTLEAVNLLLEKLANRFQFITVPELLRHGRPQRRYWYLEPDLEWLDKLRSIEA
jgi:peptidoglycan/xylan/chitin deacetylase (PgdA/CDA1 family)